MEHRIFQRLGRDVGVVGLGAWQLGADWGTVDERDALATLAAAAAAGVTFFDTADVYGDGRSEQIIGRFLRDTGGAAAHGPIMVATKMGRRVEQLPEHYVLENFLAWNDRSRRNLGVDTLDLVQLHCPPSAVFGSDAVFDALDSMVADGRMAGYGVSVETCDQALTAIARPGVASVQIILNALRLKPLELVLPAAAAAGVGIIARVPLASGRLSGRYDEHTRFADNDHRTYNRTGAAFDRGETFSGVDFATGLAAVGRLATLVPAAMSTAQFALRWIIDQPAVTVVIPGARSPEQATANAATAGFATLPERTHSAIAAIYDELVRPAVHHLW